jgi:hypothetical protein
VILAVRTSVEIAGVNELDKHFCQKEKIVAQIGNNC